MRDTGRPLVLIVDDAPGNIEVLATVLSDRYEVSFASSGAEGIDVANRYFPDLILLDIMMPGMDGIEACRHLRIIQGLHDVPIIFISALDEVSDKVKAFQSGGNDYITKPFQPEEVLARVSTHIALYRIRRELTESERSLKRHVADLESANRRLLAMGRQLAQAEKQAAVGQLAAGVAHEINNPLGFISSNLTTLERYSDQLMTLVDADIEPKLELPVAVSARLVALREAADYPFLRQDIVSLLKESRAGIERVRTTVRSLMDFSRQMDESILPIDCQSLIDEALASVWKELQPSLHVVKEYAELPTIECMRDQIVLLLGNLLRNAVQAMPSGGTLTLRTETSENEICLAVADTGVGIAPDILDRIFDPFFTTRPTGQGSGLGLSVAHGIAIKHGGRIKVVSEEGKGSEFSVYLPVKSIQQ